MWLLWLSLALLMLIIIIYIYFHKKPRSWLEPSKTNTNNTIDNSNFFSRMSNIDLKARGASSIDEYKETYKKAISSFSEKEAGALDVLVKQASIMLARYEKISRIPWKIIKSSGIEERMPHTIGDIIVLPAKFLEESHDKQVETLIHEKIHVYQRTYPIETSKLLLALGFKHWKQGRSVALLRNNPDNDSSVYSLDGIAQAQVYTSQEPKSIRDSELKTLDGEGSWNLPVQQKEHPYEVMACWISHEVLGNGPEHAQKNNIRSWMNSFL
jgi:hypothetical protein